MRCQNNNHKHILQLIECSLKVDIKYEIFTYNNTYYFNIYSWYS